MTLRITLLVNTGCLYVVCRIFFVMLSVVMLSVDGLNVLALQRMLIYIRKDRKVARNKIVSDIEWNCTLLMLQYSKLVRFQFPT